MNRRELLKGLGLVPAVTILPAVASGYPEATQETYRGFRLWWSGWRQSMNQCIYLGFWAAHHSASNSFVYSAYPGVTEKCWPGQHMNMAAGLKQNLLHPFSNVSEFDEARQDALDRLIDYLNAHYEELTHATIR